MAPYVEYELEDTPEHVGREMRKFRREDRLERRAVRFLVRLEATGSIELPKIGVRPVSMVI